MQSQIPDNSSTNPIFLPNYLLGNDPDPHTYPAIPARPPRDITIPGSFESAANVIKGRSLRQKLFNKSLTKILTQPSPFFLCEKAAPVGPPKIGLFDTIKKPLACFGLAEPTTFNNDISIILPKETLNSRKCLGKNNSHWVTVFGFPSTALNIVLALLSTCGTIMQKKHPQGNWVHIRFRNFNEVAKALSLNGKLIYKNVMIGVQLHYPSETKKTMVPSPIKAKSPRYFCIIATERNDNVIPGTNLPHKCNGIVGNTLDYVFGW